MTVRRGLSPRPTIKPHPIIYVRIRLNELMALWEEWNYYYFNINNSQFSIKWLMNALKVSVNKIHGLDLFFNYNKDMTFVSQL